MTRRGGLKALAPTSWSGLLAALSYVERKYDGISIKDSAVSQIPAAEGGTDAAGELKGAY